MIETTLVKKWLYDKIRNDPTASGLIGGSVNPRIYDGFIPSSPKNLPIADQSVKFPAVIYQLYFASEDQRLVFNQARRLWSVLNYYVKAVDNIPTFERAKDIADRIDDLIDGKDGLVEGGEIVSCLRVRPFEFQEVLSEVQYNHIGGLYQITVKRND